ncbi:uncharacterized protein LACBIDRAFT_313933 [Laccaria bicolor S238N-H82]|uniref:Predicted protein n=1 Tax=Laccaria bicolor (strain S238N-H82 / ATCC MYA-4686) TaxID=486041 RepID=B0D166_LACBS|nr:uncharacterized protein LACBIDRAFT_313933 [Laccaria bicolor S238N-H82]EDR11945.1 predicted protein [Laccaria bicolor S238N-H82]|eukprot:XP_001877842.1 predicted protein [Laccaria bicolor S238N-H82]
MSSVVSSRSRRANARLFTIMDSIFAIAFGLGLRFVVDAVSHHDFKLTGTLIGLWEGVITLHFVKKMPSSFDPYVAYGVRMFVDFLVTESLSRLILVVVWTGLGMVLADITPAIWADVGLHRIWRRFRRDLYTMSSYIPKVAFFPKARIVRFSPSRPPSVLEPTSAPATSAAPPRTRRRHVPGDFPDFISEADTDLGSILGRRPATTLDTSSVPRPRTAQYRYSGIPIIPRSDDGSTDVSSPSTQNDDLDDGNLSSSDSSSTEVDPSAFNPSEIPDEEHAAAAQEVVIVEASPGAAVAADDQTTPKQKYVPFPFPPTPSDSAARFDLRIQPNQRDLEPDLPVPPHTAGLEQIPDLSDDWENIATEEAIMSSDERPPTPPAKDDLPAAYRDKGKSRLKVEHPSTSTSSSTLTSRDLAREWGVPNPNAQPVAAAPIESTLLPSTFLSSPLVPPTGDLISLENNSDPSPPYDDDLYVIDDFTHNDNPNTNTAAGPSHVSASGYLNEKPPYDDELYVVDDYDNPNANAAGPSHVSASGYMNEKGPNNETLTMHTDTTDDSAADGDARGESSTVVVDHEEEFRRMREENQRKWDEQEKREKEEWERKQREEARLAEEERRKAEEEKQRAEAQREEEEKKWRAEEEGRIAEEERQRVEAQREEDEKKKKAEDEKRKEEQEKIRLAKAEEEKKKRETSNERRRKLSEKKRLDDEAKEKKRLEEQAKEVAKRLEEEAKKQMEEEEAAKKQKEEEDARLADEKKPAEEEALKEKQRLADEQSQEAAREALASGTTGEQTEEQTQQAGGADQEIVHTPKQQKVPFSTSQEPSAEDDIAESVITEASMAPKDAKERLKQAIILRAQMFETEKAIEGLKDQPDKEDELKGAEKTLRKMERKAKRRYESVIPTLKQEELSLDPLAPKDAERMLEATLEALITPESRALSLDITLGKSKLGSKQRPNITKVLDEFQLFSYTTADARNGKILHVTVSDADYSTWVAKYRQEASKQDADDDDDIWR